MTLNIDLSYRGIVRLITIAVGGGLMALVFYSSRNGYDDGQGRFGDPDQR